MYLDELKIGEVPFTTSKFPFSFSYGGISSEEWLAKARRDEAQVMPVGEELPFVHSYTDGDGGLRVTWMGKTFLDFPGAIEWMLWFENVGSTDTEIISDVRALDVTIESPIRDETPYILHSSHGGTPSPDQYKPYVETIDANNPRKIGAESGRSSTRNWPFFKVEAKDGSLIGAIGWSGCWDTFFNCHADNSLQISGGLEKTHFRLHPGEKVRSPRVVLLYRAGDTWEANAQFRQLVYKHYCAKRDGKVPLPTAFCNTCFTRGGSWLNECNAENQISLIEAYSQLGIEALMTDAGWFTGGWPDGAGNWDPRKDAYPQGMGPVAKAAKDNNMVYGLWFEPERVMLGTAAQKDHPDWCLGSQPDGDQTFLLNFGLKEVQDYFFNIVKGFMDLPGFRVYRQDFNMDPLPYWRFNDAEDRQGMTEMKYIEGLYAYWDRILSAYPDAFLEECAGGGHRYDLETIMRMHAHQDSDYWFRNTTDQAGLWGVSQYAPNNTVVSHLIYLDDYSFHSNLASSLCLGWIADDPEFDSDRGAQILKRYGEVRHLLVGAWYPLLPYSSDDKDWTGSQYYRSDLGEGLLLVFRRENSPYRTVDVKLRGLDPGADYELMSDRTGTAVKKSGDELMSGFQIELNEPRSSDLIIYRKL